jgi:hypothetical protein
VLPIPQAKPVIHGETRRVSFIHGGTGRGAVTGLVEKVSRVTDTTTKVAATAAEYTICLGSLPAGMLSCAAIQTRAIANTNCAAEAPHVKSGPNILRS